MILSVWGCFVYFLEFITMNFCNWLVGVILGTGTDFSGIFSILVPNEIVTKISSLPFFPRNLANRRSLM